MRLNAAAAQAIGLALHELATNAGKYGALSTDMGRVDVGWAMTDDTFTMSWTERKGPPVRPPERKGFGSTVIDSMAGRTLGGEVQLDYAPSGLGWRLTCPAANALKVREARVDVIERAEAGETVTQAQIKEIVDKAVIASRAEVEVQVQRARDEADRRVVERRVDPSKYRFS